MTFTIYYKHPVPRKLGNAHHLPHAILTVKPGCGSIMLWWCFSAAGTGGLVRNEGKLNRLQDKEILHENLLQSTQDLRLDRRTATLGTQPRESRSGLGMMWE